MSIADHIYDKASIYLYLFYFILLIYVAFFTWIIIIIYLFIFRLIQYRLRLGLHRALLPHIETLLGKTWFKLWSSSDVWQCCLTDTVRQQEHIELSHCDWKCEEWRSVWNDKPCPLTQMRRETFLPLYASNTFLKCVCCLFCSLGLRTYN